MPIYGAKTYTPRQASWRVGHSVKAIYRILRAQHIIDNSNRPYSEYVDAGYMFAKQGGFYHRGLQREVEHIKPLFTDKGLVWLDKLIKENNDHATH